MKQGGRDRAIGWVPGILGTVLLLLLPSAAFSAGQVDPSFDGDGKLFADLGREDSARDVTIQADGKIVVVGQSGTFDGDFAISRHNPDGSLDSTFGGGDGEVLTDFGDVEEASGVAIQPDGKIVAAGSTIGTAAYRFALARYYPDGSLDATFDDDGRVVTAFSGSARANDVAIQADGKIVAVGGTLPSGANQRPPNFALARYNANGSLDQAFHDDGRLATDFHRDDDGAFAIAIQADGKIVAAGNSRGVNGGNFALARYNQDGSLDASFGGDGKVVSRFPGNEGGPEGLEIQADGKIVAAGSTIPFDSSPGGYEFALARYLTDGSLDATFHGDGKVMTDFGREFDIAHDVAIQADGKIVAVGLTGGFSFDPPSDFALARYKPFGSLDPSFDADGRVVTDFGADEEANGVAIQADGKIVAVGQVSGGPWDFALARYIATSPSISITDVAKLEGNAGATTFSFTVSLSAPSSQTIRVTRQTADGSATAPSDYTALGAATFTFSPGQTTKTAIVKVKGDVAGEPNETFFVNLSNATNATIADGQGKGTILSDDLSDSPRCTITGTNRNDVLTGTSGNDVICGRRRDDQIYGLGGNDVLKGGSGDDLLVGGNGYDLLIGDVGTDDLRGEAGNDTLRAGDDGDALDGGSGSDALFGDAGGDSLDAQDGVSANDSADGGSESDSCVFDAGDFVTSCP